MQPYGPETIAHGMTKCAGMAPFASWAGVDIGPKTTWKDESIILTNTTGIFLATEREVKETSDSAGGPNNKLPEKEAPS